MAPVVTPPMEMCVTCPSKPTHDDMADLPALVARLVGLNLRFGVGWAPLRHGLTTVSELRTPEQLNYREIRSAKPDAEAFRGLSRDDKEGA